MAKRINMPKLGLNMKEGLLVEWLVPDGEKVLEGQALFTVETDKVTNEVNAESEGVLRHVAEAEDTIPVSGLVGYILEPSEKMPEKEESKIESNEIVNSPKTQADSSAQRTVLKQGRILASPKAKRLAQDLDVDLADVEGTGPNGRISSDDVERAAAQKHSGMQDREEVIKISTLRQTIAKNMQNSSQETASVTLMRTVNADALVSFRARINDGKSNREKVSYNAILICAAVIALKEFSLMNASYQNEQLTVKKTYHIGLAVDTEEGLLAPVIRNVGEKGITEVQQDLSALLARVSKKMHTAEDLSGSSFTITNLGALGVEFFTPVINLPDMAILGVGQIVKEPLVDGEDVRAGWRVFLSLTFDHRWVDGAYAAKFLQKIITVIENPDHYLE
jgi:pyruvate dehydrogenase E2 component (dihydrolipoamide acetyltransferase)